MAEPTRTGEVDRVELIIREWRERRPDLEFRSLELVSRVLRAAHHLQVRLDDVAAAYGLSHSGDLDVLTDLYRAGPPHERTPTQLAESLMLTAGGMTVRLHRLEDAGLIRRSPNPRDRRGVIVALTKVGEEIADHALVTALETQADSVAMLDRLEADRLATLLRRLLIGLGDNPPFRPDITA